MVSLIFQGGTGGVERGVTDWRRRWSAVYFLDKTRVSTRRARMLGLLVTSLTAVSCILITSRNKTRIGYLVFSRAID